MMDLQETLIYGLTMGSAGCGAVMLYPTVRRAAHPLLHRATQFQQAKAEQASRQLDDIFVDVKPRWLQAAYGVAPVLAALVAFSATNSLLVAVGGAVLGALIPDLWLRQAKAERKRRFQSQLVDILFVLSSSLRAGFSLQQAFEQIEVEMDPPASQEFGLLMKGHRLGRTLEECLHGLQHRMTSYDLDLVVTAMLVSRETGGDVTTVLNQLVSTIRDRKKLADKVTTLTLQGRLQAYIMSALPLVFAFFVRTFNPRYFDPLFKDSHGQTIVLIAAGLWVVGMALLVRFSKVEI